jgi:hypothetical protein
VDSYALSGTKPGGTAARERRSHQGTALAATLTFRQPRRCSAARSGSACRRPAAPGGELALRRLLLACVRALPVEREVLARTARPVPLEAEAIGFVDRRDAPGRDLSGADFGPRRIVDLDTLPLGGRRPRQRLGSRLRLAGGFSGPAAPGGCTRARSRPASPARAEPPRLRAAQFGGQTITISALLSTSTG